MRKIFLNVALGLALLSAGATPLSAATVFVDVLNTSFSPNDLQVEIGDTVTWINHDDDADNSHTTTSTTGVWSGVLVDFGDTFSFTFSATGTFPYRDQTNGFTGVIVVVQKPVTPAPMLSDPRFLGGKFQFFISGLSVGKTNMVQASTNLTNWISLQTTVATNATNIFIDTQTPPLPRRFYRVVQSE